MNNDMEYRNEIEFIEKCHIDAIKQQIKTAFDYIRSVKGIYSVNEKTYELSFLKGKYRIEDLRQIAETVKAIEARKRAIQRINKKQYKHITLDGIVF